jgi:hypothetical protein
MKTRSGFVSNSSSSSFIIANEKDKKELSDAFNYVKFFKVKDLKEKYENFLKNKNELIRFYSSVNGNYPIEWFDMYNSDEIDIENEERMKMLNEVLTKYGDEVEFSSPVDRDLAIDKYVYLHLFEGDL